MMLVKVKSVGKAQAEWEANKAKQKNSARLNHAKSFPWFFLR
jgi:hypothetical protein